VAAPVVAVLPPSGKTAETVIMVKCGFAFKSEGQQAKKRLNAN